jgi:hypothetical protein
MGNELPPAKDVLSLPWPCAWRNAFAMTLLGCLFVGSGCLVLLGAHLLQQIESQRLNLFHAAVAWEIGFAVAMGIILGIIIVWQRSKGSSLGNLDGGDPPRRWRSFSPFYSASPISAAVLSEV